MQADSPLAYGTSAEWVGRWSEELGHTWRLQLALIATCLFVVGVSAPLADPDLPLHLATGEWVLQHRAVPFVEPWAWTRAGQPYFAYSWAIDTAYYVLLEHFGPSALAILHGAIGVALGASIFCLGWLMRWTPWTTIVVMLLHILVSSSVVPFLRPQEVLLVVTPLVWGLVARMRDTKRLRWELPALTALTAVAANTHLLFPITAAPCVLLFIRRPLVQRRLVLVPGAIVLGWLITPYATHWAHVFALNFAPNPLNFAPGAMAAPPSTIAEFTPGFSSAFAGGPSSYLFCCALAFLPWVAAPRLGSAARGWYGMLWLAGLVMFALAVRALAVWWLVIIPMTATAIDAIPRATLPIVRTAQRGVVVAIFLIMAMNATGSARDPWLAAGTVSQRRLPSTAAKSIEPIAEWLDCYVRRGGRGRLVTTFNFGSYIPWRLPYLSESIDGRTIFPDSIARAESYFPPNRPTIPLQPWRSADLAIVPLNVPVAAVLDSAKGWRRVAITSQLAGRPSMIGLWVTQQWWSSAGAAPLPSGVVPLYHGLGPAPACPSIHLAPLLSRRTAPEGTARGRRSRRDNRTPDLTLRWHGRATTRAAQRRALRLA